MAKKWKPILLWLLKLLIRIIGWRPREILLRWLTLQYARLIEVKPRSRYGRQAHRYRRR